MRKAMPMIIPPHIFHRFPKQSTQLAGNIWTEELRNSNSNGPDKPREDLQTLQWLEILPDPGDLAGELRNFNLRNGDRYGTD